MRLYWLTPVVELRAFHYDMPASLAACRAAFVTEHTLATHIKALRWGTSFQAVCDAWVGNPTPFMINPYISARDRTSNGQWPVFSNAAPCAD